jgi:hypothetical protein
VAETADEAHAVQLAGLLLEAADQQHLSRFAKGFKQKAVEPCES